MAKAADSRLGRGKNQALKNRISKYHGYSGQDQFITSVFLEEYIQSIRATMVVAPDFVYFKPSLFMAGKLTAQQMSE